MDKGFFRPASRTVGFSLRIKNSGHVIIFLWLCCLHGGHAPATAKEMLKTKTGRSYVPAKALSEDIRRWRPSVFL